MLQQPGRISFPAMPDNRVLQNQPTSTAESEEGGDADEPPDPKLHGSASTDSMASTQSEFQKFPCSKRNQESLITRSLHHSESDSHVDEEDYAFYEPHRATSSASTYSRSSAVSMTELTSEASHTSPRTSSPSPPVASLKLTGIPPVFKQNTFQAPATVRAAATESIAPSQKVLPNAESEQKVEAGLGRKRCIMFACGANKTEKAEEPKKEPVVSDKKKTAPEARKCSLKFVCPTRDGALEPSKPHIRLASPAPVRRSQASPKQTKVHRGSDSTVRTSSPKTVRKISSGSLVPPHRRRDSGGSDMSRSEATRFHEFASSEEEVDDWTKESTCYQRPLTIDDSLAMENNLRKLGREVEEEEADEDTEAAIDDDDEFLEEEEDEDEDDEDEDVDRSVHSGYISDEGFQTDDEQGFAHSDDESDGGSDYDWWAPGRAAARDNIEHIRPPRNRRGSDSTIESAVDNGIPISPQLRRKSSRPSNRQEQGPELPDSTDFVCGTLDEDKPLEQAFLNHLQQRRQAKHKLVPQDIDPTFPTSDPEIDDEEDEVSEHAATDSDHPMFHGEMDMHEDADRRNPRMVPKKRSPIPSPRRLKSPPPAKRINLHRSPPPTTRRARSPVLKVFGRARLSSSVPRRQSQIAMREAAEEVAAAAAVSSSLLLEDDPESTPRFSRRAVDIVIGLERKRQRRREKLYEKYCRKAAKTGKTKEKKPLMPGKGAERMRDLGIGLNEYRGRKQSVVQQTSDEAEVHMLSY